MHNSCSQHLLLHYDLQGGNEKPAPLGAEGRVAEDDAASRPTAMQEAHREQKCPRYGGY